MTALTLATILIAGGLNMAPQAFSTGSGGNNDDKKDKKGGEDSNKYKDWKKENEKHDDDDEEHDKVKICHIPDGNPANAHTIEISESALASHLDHDDTLGACPDDDDEEEPAHIIIIRAITDDNNKAYNIDDFTISIDGVVQDLGLPIPIVPNTEKTITGVVPEGYKFVLIAGDPSCPVNINGDTFSLKKGQTIVCTIYYDDLYVPGGAAGPNPTITIVNNVASDPDPFGIIVSPIVGVPNTINPTTTKYTVDSHTTVTISGSDDSPILITGDGNCPENNGGFVNIQSGQDITCIYSDRQTDEAGVVFRPTHVTFVPGQTATWSLPDGSGDVTIDATSFDTIIVNDPEFNKPTASSLIIVYSLIATPYDGQPIQCFSEGIVPTGSGNGFRLACTSLTADEYSLNYALINTIDITS
jgi:hypothetical protein